ncbi:bifunctional phosphopantothenoylcysteine decarboxylase/phosphopantothenate--cysteine ligase CoaBC [Polynucleobacter necessarius]|uniref:bifunctional phosphopantothenoylcysteine decarboxylase/phosphopantothenate--cysteine ligase CoaBC n=1 Tax=Polynucleobacter necessarius TaxID=576610 RepID=UPI000E08F2B2|nr:bifunctional phosphopantothenoylcysteine decarboxylase/phosphopantothenate--cysteine ligase CoaBC [Polynucleobacter necessarius]HAT40029.1 bifunctional phosphopantothenoylcysteine decarboxylase/phosphopantothenate--cysteine ligase CoaBC [Polynucleobacter sp.]
MQSLLNKKIVLGLSGGIAAYKAPELARQLIQEGASVQAVMTEAAQQFGTAVTMQALTGNPVYLSQWDSTIPNNMAHIELSRSADAILIAPASADLMAKLSLGLADDLLSTLCLARDCPLLLAPAMNKQMWEHAATQRSAKRLSEDGVALLGPASGFQACGEVGMGRMLEPAEITEQVIAFFQQKILAGKKVVITAGPTFEAIDPMRGITNHSSGKMGFAIARAAVEAGAQVHLIAGPCELETPLLATGQITRTNVVSAKEMHSTALSVSDCDIFFAAAAVADWGIAQPAKEKIKRQGNQAPNIEFVANPDILLDIAKAVKTKAGKPYPYCVGFAAESTDLEKHANEKRKRKNIPMIVGNIGPETFGSDLNQLLVIDANSSKKIATAEKLQLARQLIQLVAKKI